MARGARTVSVFQAAADPTRRQIIDLLGNGDRPVLAIAEQFDMTLSAISQHLKVLKDAGLVTDQRDGRQRFYHLQPEALEEMAEWTAQHVRAFWNQRLGALGTLLASKEKKR
jgi:DNA-binding transcriptional ArsR family regulator